MISAMEQRVRHYWTLRSHDFGAVRKNELENEMGQKWLREIERLLPEKEHLRILDVGTGTGFFAVLLAQAGHQVEGIDLTPAMLEEARLLAAQRNLDIVFREMDAQALSYYKWISKDDDSHFIYVNFKENESGVYTVSAYNTSGFSGTEAIEKYLDIVKAEAAEANKAASANAEMKDFSVEIAQFAKDDVKVKIMTKIPVSGWSYDDGPRCLVENDDPTAFGAGAIQFEVRENVEKIDFYKDKFENYQDIEDRVIGGITFRGRTYKYIGYEWIQYIAQLDDNRALSIGLRNMDCVPGTMPDIILTNMTFQ